MAANWQPLRAHLREHAERWIDDLIRSDPDRQLRAYLAAHRAQAVERLTDQAELATLRHLLAEREQAEQAEHDGPSTVRLNGSRTIKVAPR